MYSKQLATHLENASHNVVFVGDAMSGISDERILAKSERENRILITDDKDFGELVFRLGRPSSGLLLLRTRTTNPSRRFQMIQELLEAHDPKGKFIVIKEGSIRIRKL